jgi:probable phosphoglycerate mutase
MAIQQVYLARHGETEWSLSGQHTGITDIPLTENGRNLAKRLAPVLATESVRAGFDEPARTRAEDLQLAGLGAHAEIDRDLMEWNYGEYEGLTRNRSMRRCPDG